MTITSPFLFKLGCLSMVSVIGLGAAYGHAGRLSEVGTPIFAKTQLYNTTNALGLLGCSLIPKSTIPLKIAVGAFLIGQAFFIAPLYYTAITDKRIPYFAKVVPAGGTSMIFAWGSLMFAV